MVTRRFCALQMGAQRRNLDQPHLADLDAFEFTVAQQSAQVLAAIARDLGCSLDCDELV